MLIVVYAKGKGCLLENVFDQSRRKATPELVDALGFDGRRDALRRETRLSARKI